VITIDLRSRVPIYEQLVENIRKSIISGEMKPDEQLPSVRALALELGINPNTIQKALSELERQGAIYTLKGRGSFVASNTEELGLDEFKAIEGELEKLLRRAKESGMTGDIAESMLNALCEKIWKI